MSESKLPDAFRSFLEESRAVLHLRVDGSGRILGVNRAFADLLEASPDSFCGRDLGSLLSGADVDEDRFVADLRSPRDGVLPFRFVRIPHADGADLVGEGASGSSDRAVPSLVRLNNELAVLSREHARRGRELEAALAEIDRSYWHLKKIQEVLPICMDCGRVKTGEASWESVVDYLKKNSLFLSHGYCPECADRARAAMRRREPDE